MMLKLKQGKKTNLNHMYRGKKKKLKIDQTPLRKSLNIRECLARVRSQEEQIRVSVEIKQTVGEDESATSSPIINLLQKPLANPAPRVQQRHQTPFITCLETLKNIFSTKNIDFFWEQH